MTRLESKISGLVDWDTIKYYAEDIESYIGKMLSNKLDYTGDIRFDLEKIKEIFEDAESRSQREIDEEYISSSF